MDIETFNGRSEDSAAWGWGFLGLFFLNLALWLVPCPGNLMLLATILRFSVLPYGL